jgi:UDP-N-acetylmuramate dehydrogenase
VSLLRKFSTIKIAGEAERICWVSELPRSLEELPQPWRVLGNGSNVLIGEKLKGSVILTRDPKVSEPRILEENSDWALVEVEAGVFLPRLAKWASERGLSGAEYMVGVPGTVGGAVVQNAGANQQEMKDVLEGVEWLDFLSTQRKWISKDDTNLTYRKSNFQTQSGLVLKAHLKLLRDDPEKIQNRTQLNLDYRRQKTPFAKPSLGSMYTRLLKNGGVDPADLWHFPGQLIEAAGMKAFRIGDIQVSEEHANYFVNLGKARFEDVRELMKRVEEAVFKNSGLELEPEIQIWET